MEKGKLEFNEGLGVEKLNEDSVQSDSVQEEVEQKSRRAVEFVISQSEQVAATTWAEGVKAKVIGTLKPSHSDVILCIIGVRNKYIVSGGKDGLLNVAQHSGSKVATLRGHEASVCSLALI